MARGPQTEAQGQVARHAAKGVLMHGLCATPVGVGVCSREEAMGRGYPAVVFCDFATSFPSD